MRRRDLHGQMISSMKGSKSDSNPDPLETQDENVQMDILDRHPGMNAFVTAAKKGESLDTPESPSHPCASLTSPKITTLFHSLLVRHKPHLFGSDGLPPGATVTAGPNGSVGYSVPRAPSCTCTTRTKHIRKHN